MLCICTVQEVQADVINHQRSKLDSAKIIMMNWPHQTQHIPKGISPKLCMYTSWYAPCSYRYVRLSYNNSPKQDNYHRLGKTTKHAQQECTMSIMTIQKYTPILALINWDYIKKSSPSQFKLGSILERTSDFNVYSKQLYSYTPKSYHRRRLDRNNGFESESSGKPTNTCYMHARAKR